MRVLHLHDISALLQRKLDHVRSQTNDVFGKGRFRFGIKSDEPFPFDCPARRFEVRRQVQRTDLLKLKALKQGKQQYLLAAGARDE